MRLAAAWAVLGLAGCVDHEPGLVNGTQSLRIDLVAPTTTGTQDNPLPDSARSVKFNVTALDPLGNTDPTFTREVQVYAQFLGTLTPALGSAMPLGHFMVTNGVAMNQTVMLPPVFGQTTLWIDDGADMDPTYATGTSPTLFFRNPFIADIQTPVDETASTALSVSPLQNKQISVTGSRYGANGRLIVTSIFAQGYTVADVKCGDPAGTPPCVSAAYDSLEVFSFSAPMDQQFGLLAEGETISGFSGGISEFDGLTEVGFPQSFVATPQGMPDVNPAREPAPVKIDTGTWFNPLGDTTGEINFERNEAGLLELDGGVVCALDTDFGSFNQWKIDPAGPVAGQACTNPGTGDLPAQGSCMAGQFCVIRGIETAGVCAEDCTNLKNIINVVSAGTVSTLDPSTLQGVHLSKILGIERPLNISASFNLWIIYPRSMSDITQ